MDLIDPEIIRKIAAIVELHQRQFPELQAAVKRFLDQNDATFKALQDSVLQVKAMAELRRLPILSMAGTQLPSNSLTGQIVPIPEGLTRFRGFRPTASIRVTKSTSAIPASLSQRIKKLEGKNERLGADNKRLRRQLAQTEAMATEALAIAQDARARLAAALPPEWAGDPPNDWPYKN